MIKKITILSFCFATFGYAQEVSDGLNYSLENFGGTARYRAMGGAFGALGGDLSALNVNPAGSAVFNNNQFGASLSFMNRKNTSNYFNESTDTKESFADLNQEGAIFVFHNDEKTVRKISFGFNFENAPTFRNLHQTKGINPNQSIASYFKNYANGGSLNVIGGSYENINRFDDLQGWLGYNGFVINPLYDEPSNTAYVSNVVENNLRHNYMFQNEGQNGKIALNFAMQIKERLFLGTNINLHYVEQRRFQTFNENHANQTNASQSLINTSFFTDLFTQGNGFSMQLGAIYKITPDLRGGLSYESPTWFTFNESIYQSVRSNYFDFNDNIAKAAFVDTDEIILPEYNLRTPGKITGSLAYLIGEKGLINLDYGYKDFTQMRFSADGANYNDMNDVIKNTFTASHDVRIGGEYRYKKFSFRGGYRLETTPYKNNDIMGNLTAYSGGLGYNFGNTKVDMAFSTMQRESKQKFFEAANISAPALTNRLNNLTLTVLFEL